MVEKLPIALVDHHERNPGRLIRWNGRVFDPVTGSVTIEIGAGIDAEVHVFNGKADGRQDVFGANEDEIEEERKKKCATSDAFEFHRNAIRRKVPAIVVGTSEI